jgi:AraC-like DNA-binding protein
MMSRAWSATAAGNPVATDSCQGTAMQFWRPLPGKLMDVVCGEGSAERAPSRHVHEALQILLPSTPLIVTTASETHVVDRDSIHFTSPLEVCTARGVDSRGFHARVMLIGPALLEKLRDCQRPPVGVARDAHLVAAFSTLFAELRRPAIDVECASRLIESLRALFTVHAECATPVRISEGVARARDYLRAHAVERVTLDELATTAFLSKFYLLRSFHRALGLTPHEYQMQLRLARARRLLCEGRSLSRVTYDAGFADQSHLTRRFAAFYEMTPARFARQANAPFAEGLSQDVPETEWSAAPAPAA